jgi:hypothetical protein
LNQINFIIKVYLIKGENMTLLEQIENLRTEEEKELLEEYPSKTLLNRWEQGLWREYKESGRLDVLYPTDKPSNYEPVLLLQIAKAEEFFFHLHKQGYKPSHLYKEYVKIVPLLPPGGRLIRPKRAYKHKVSLLTWKA